MTLGDQGGGRITLGNLKIAQLLWDYGICSSGVKLSLLHENLMTNHGIGKKIVGKRQGEAYKVSS
jgi:hypothetical protein